MINNVNVFVRLSGFIHPTSRRVVLESSKRTTHLRSFLGLLWETTPTILGSRHRSRLWSHMPHSFETSGQNRRFWKSLLGCARRYIVCPSSVRQGDPPATLYDHEWRPKTRPILKPRSVTERTPPSFRYYIYVRYFEWRENLLTKMSLIFQVTILFFIKNTLILIPWLCPSHILLQTLPI